MGYVQIATEESPIYEGASTLLTPYRVSTNVFYLPIQTLRLAPNPQHIDRADELRNIEGGIPLLIDAFEPDGNIAERAYANYMTVLLNACGFTGVATTGANGTNEVQTIATTGVPTGGSFTVVFEGNTSAPIPWNATAVQLKAILEALPTMLAGDLTCAAGPLPTAITVTFGGTRAYENVPQFTLGTNSLTGGTTPAPVFATTTGGVVGSVLDPDGRTIAVGATRWVFTKRGGLTAKTLQLIAAYSEALTYFRGNGYGVSNLTISSAGDVSADLMGLTMLRIADPALTPSYDTQAIPPLRRADLFLTWLAGSGETDDFSLAIANPLARRKSFVAPTRSYFSDRMLHGDERVRVSGSIPKYGLDPDDYDALMTAATFTAKARFKSDKAIAASPTRYGMWIEMPACQYNAGGPEELANRRRFGATFDWWAAYDEAAGYDVKITLANAVAAVETYV